MGGSCRPRYGGGGNRYQQQGGGGGGGMIRTICTLGISIYAVYVFSDVLAVATGNPNYSLKHNRTNY